MYDEKILFNMSNFYETHSTLSYEFRLHYLKKFKEIIIAHEEEIFDALYEDLGKSPFESLETEVGLVYEEIDYMVKNLKKLMKPKRVSTPLMHFPSKSRIYYEPFGIALIIAPWNYPFQLSFIPLIGAIAAGNCVVLKPSEFATSIGAIMEKIVTETFSPKHVTVIEGGKSVSESLLDYPFDFIFFTGSISVGKIIMEKASKNLTPVVLELGGKSPCIIDRGYNLSLAARRVAWGKCLNSGQTCVAPDYLFIHEDDIQQFIVEFKKSIEDMFGSNPLDSNDYPRIINQHHFDRIINLMHDGTIVCGGTNREDTLKISPTLITNVNWNSPIMTEEIFGPLLPILSYTSIEQVVRMVNKHPKPLACYCFSNSKETQDKIIKEIPFGGGCINDTIVHLATTSLPFSGVGSSGMGNYHGKFSFETFSHKKSILLKSSRIDVPVRYSPYTNKLKILRHFFH